METAVPYIEVADAIRAAGGKDLNRCYQCATCTGSCPWSWVQKPLNMRRLLHLAQLGLEGYESDDLWRCTTCATCQDRCPRGVDILGIVRSVRAMLSETGSRPPSLRSAFAALASEGNPWAGARGDRNRWSDGLLPAFDRTRHEYLLFACCMPSYDARSRRIAEAAAKVLRAAGVKVGVLDTRESCCGESVRRSGDEALWQALAVGNGALFDEVGAERILTLSPHCLHTIRNEYPEAGRRVQVRHVSELLAELVEQGRLQPRRKLDGVAVWHDPCYLGRHNGVFDAPRKVLLALPGLQVREMLRSRERSLCCGGGGGRMWQETAVGERFGDLRVPEALHAGATVLATGCPYCVSMFESSRQTLGREADLQVKDLCELVADTLEGGE